jgi:hypothetical protein
MKVPWFSMLFLPLLLLSVDGGTVLGLDGGGGGVSHGVGHRRTTSSRRLHRRHNHLPPNQQQQRKTQAFDYDTPSIIAESAIINRNHYNSDKSCKSGGKGSYYGIGKGKGSSSGGGGGKGGGYYDCAPTVSPAPSSSSMPSATPSVSNAPSPSPSSAPSPEPTRSPSSPPTTTPSERPTSSLVPTMTPSWEPTVSVEPSSSASPTDVLMVTVPIEDGNDDDTMIGWESLCVENPPTATNGTLLFQDQQFVFLYHLFVNNTSINTMNTTMVTLPPPPSSYQSIVDEVEERIHHGLVEHFMTCLVTEDYEFDWYIWSIRSQPQDRVTPFGTNEYDYECVPDPTTNDPVAPPNSSCVRVVAQLHMTAYFVVVNRAGSNDNNSGSGRRRRRLEPEAEEGQQTPSAVTVADPEIMSETGKYLHTAMSDGDYDDEIILQTTFKGFILEENVHDILGTGSGDGDSGGNNIAAATGQAQAQNDDDRLIIGMTFVVFALLCLFALMAIIRRRRRRFIVAHLEYLKQKDDDNATDLDQDFGMYSPTIECDDNSWLDGINGGGGFGSTPVTRTTTMDSLQEEQLSSSNYQHDVHNCVSATCEICRRHETNQPIFLSSTVSKETLDILDDLEGLRQSPSMSSRSDKRSYSSADMVAL